MIKKMVLCFIVMCISIVSIFSADLYGFIESYEVNDEYQNQIIFLDQNKAIRDGNGNLLAGIEKLTLSSYSNAVLNTLLTAGEKGWCVRFTVESLADGVLIKKVKTPYKIAPVPVAGLVAEYLFENNADDSSGNLNHGVARNGLTYKSGLMGQAGSFDGIDDFIEITPQSDVSAIGDFTISVWTYVTGWQPATVRQYIFDGHTWSKTTASDYYRPGFGVIYDKNNGNEEIHNFIRYGDSSFLELNTQHPVGKRWVHLVFTRRGNQDATYIDGSLLKTTYSANVKRDTALNMQHDWYIGCFSGNNSHYPQNTSTQYKFQGLLDNMRLYNRALSEEEIEILFREID